MTIRPKDKVICSAYLHFMIYFMEGGGTVEFETALSREQIMQRLLVFAKPLKGKSFGYFSENEFLSKWEDNGTFYLLRTAGAFSVKPVLPFVGKVVEREDSTVIVGKFGLAKAMKIMLLCFFGLAWIPFSFICFLNPNYDIAGKLFVFSMICIWTASVYAIFRFVPALFQKQQQEAVLEFIEKHLLR